MENTCRCGHNRPPKVTARRGAQGAFRACQTRFRSRLPGSWCGARLEVASASRSPRKLRVTTATQAAHPAVAEGAAVPELYSLTQAVVATSRAAAPRDDCAVGGDERANGGRVTWTMWPAETSAWRTVVKTSTANGRAPDPAPRARMLASERASPPLRVCGRKASPGPESSRSDDVVSPARASDVARPVVCVGLRSP